MRILMISHEFSRSGASRMFVNLARHLIAAGHVLTVYPIVPADGPARGELEAAGVEICESIVERAFDLAIANTICAAPVIVSIGAAVPTIWWIHEAEVGLMILLQQPQWLGAFTLAAAIVLPSAFQRDDIFRPFLLPCDPRRVVVIPNGIEAVQSGPRPESAVPPVPPVPVGTVRVVCVGTVDTRKRQSDLIEAVEQLGGLAIECIFCGAVVNLPPAASRMAQAAPDRYRLLGDTAEPAVRSWLSSADIFCLPSTSEVQSLATLEAAMLARPLVLTDLPSYRGTFAHGRDALMVPVGDTDLLAATLEALASRPTLRARLGGAARATALRFTMYRFTRAFDELIEVVTNRTPCATYSQV